MWLGSSIRLAALSPHLPGRRTGAPKTLEFLLVFECVHATPEPIVWIANQLLLINESPEWLIHEFLAGSHVVEDLLAKYEVPAIDPYRPIPYGLNAGDQARVGVGRDSMVAQVREHTQEAGDPILATEVVGLPLKRKIGETVTVVRQELLFAIEISLDGFQSLSNI